jgi:hypothetical protein
MVLKEMQDIGGLHPLLEIFRLGRGRSGTIDAVYHLRAKM